MQALDDSGARTTAGPVEESAAAKLPPSDVALADRKAESSVAFRERSTPSTQPMADTAPVWGKPETTKEKSEQLALTRVRHRQWGRYVKTTALILGGVVAYYQYLDQSIQSTISREEALFVATSTQLDSNSEAVRAAAVRTIYELAFKRTPVESPPSPVAPVLNLTKWMLYPPQYRNFQRC